MKKLEIELFRYGTLVFGKVLHQDESLRKSDKKERANILAKDDNFKIASYDSPELRPDTLYIRGEDIENDDLIFLWRYDTEETAIKKCEQIKACLDIINKDETDKDKIQGIERVI